MFDFDFDDLAEDPDQHIEVDIPKTKPDASWSVRQLKAYLGEKRVNIVGCTEKHELVDLAKVCAQRLAAVSEAPSPPPASESQPPSRSTEDLQVFEAMKEQLLPMPSRSKFFIVSSLGDWKDMEEMEWYGAGYKYRGRMTSGGHSFKILREGKWSEAIYPSVKNSNPVVAHVVMGPNNRGHGYQWCISADRWGGMLEVKLCCPIGYPLSLTWARPGAECPDALPGKDQEPARPDSLKQWWMLNGTKTYFGQWKLEKELGRGKQHGAVFLARSHERTAAVKFPVAVREMQYLGAMRGVAGVPEVLEVGHGADGDVFLATQVLGLSLATLLQRCENAGDRMAWSSAQGLGLSLLSTLQGIHARGLVHLDLNPNNILAGDPGAGNIMPYLVDFGMSRPIGSAYFEKVGCTLEYNSIRSGFPGERTPLDDLESLGWLLLRCVTGVLPWQPQGNAIDWSDRAARYNLSASMTLQKKKALKTSFESLGGGPEGCPDQLERYLLYLRGLAESGNENVDYNYLGSFLTCRDGAQNWAAWLSKYVTFADNNRHR